MAYTVTVEGIDQVRAMLNRLEGNASGVAAKALYEGAGIMADEMQDQASAIKTEPFHYAVFVQRAPSPEEKAVVTGVKKIGIAKFKQDGNYNVNTSVGYARAGYAMMVGKRVPIPKIANAINSGTSFMKKQPFVRKAASSGAQKAEAAITKMIEQKFNEIIK